MFVLTPFMVSKYGLPSGLTAYTTKGNMSVTYREAYEPVMGPAFKRAVEENPEAVRILMSGPTSPKFGGWPREVQEHFEAAAAEHGLTAAEFFFGLEPGYQSLFEECGDSSDLLGMILLRDEPVQNLRRLREIAEIQGRRLLWENVWRSRSYIDDWFVRWIEATFNSKHLPTVIRGGFSAEECLVFLNNERQYIDMTLRGIPLHYALACGPFDPEKIRRCWDERLPPEYVRSLLAV